MNEGVVCQLLVFFKLIIDDDDMKMIFKSSCLLKISGVG